MMDVAAVSVISGKKKNLVFRATVFKTLGRVGWVFFKELNLNYKNPNEKNGILLGSSGSDRKGRVAQNTGFFF